MCIAILNCWAGFAIAICQWVTGISILESIRLGDVEVSRLPSDVERTLRSCDVIKPVFYFNRILAKRSVFHCFVNTQAELMIWTQYNTLPFAK